MSDFLDLIAALASATPCQVPRADLLRLLTRAGLGKTQAFRAVADMAADPVTVNCTALLRLVAIIQEKS